MRFEQRTVLGAFHHEVLEYRLSRTVEQSQNRGTRPLNIWLDPYSLVRRGYRIGRGKNTKRRSSIRAWSDRFSPERLWAHHTLMLVTLYTQVNTIQTLEIDPKSVCLF